jgi:hypothetical protein
MQNIIETLIDIRHCHRIYNKALTIYAQNIMFLYEFYMKERFMKVREGDILVCTCDDCKVELTVTKSCDDKTCKDCDIDVKCCGKPMKLKRK